MTNEEIKQFIARKTAENMSLSQIQDALNEQGCKLSFMDLRLLASELDEEVWKAQEPVKAEEPKTEEKPAAGAESEAVPEDTTPETAGAAAAETPADDAGKVRGKTTVEISPLMRPGTVASGTVHFGSGVTAEWFLDQTGRLGLDKTTGKPDQQDVLEFQQELQKAFGGA